MKKHAGNTVKVGDMEEVKRMLEELRVKLREGKVDDVKMGISEVSLKLLTWVADRARDIDKLYTLYLELQHLFLMIDRVENLVMHIAQKAQLEGIINYNSAIQALEDTVKILERIDEIIERLRDGKW